MLHTANGEHTVRFGTFELDLRSGELRRAGIRVALQDQPFRILVRLLERPGDLVTREQLRHDLWPDAHFGDFEHGLNAAIKRLRDALDDSSENPRFIETLPRRGYRFIAPVQSHAAQQPAGEWPPPAGHRWRAKRGLALGVAGALIAATAVGFSALRRPAKTATDLIVIADFENQTSESVLTGTLKQALAVKFGEAHSINVISDDRVREVLSTMRREPEEPLTPRLAREVCQRAGGTVTLSGAVASVGRVYAISLNATSCSTGEVLARDEREAASQEEILPTIDGMATRLRGKLGESRRSIGAANTPLERATTSSLDALKAFTEGERRLATKNQLDSLPFYRRAIELDPEFAMAHAKLAVVCFNNNMSCGVRELTRAFELRNRLTEREQFYVTAHYHRLAQGDMESSRSTYELWKASYPDDPVPYNALGFVYARQGHFDRAIPEFEGAARVSPTGFHYSNLVDSYLAVDRIADAERVLRQWEQQIAAPIHFVRFLIAFQRRDPAAVERNGASLRDGEEGVANAAAEQARAAAFFGKMRRARELFAMAARAREGTEFAEGSALLKLEEAIWEAEVGDCSRAQDRIKEATLVRESTSEQSLTPAILGLTAIAFGACGDVARAESALKQLTTLQLRSRSRPTLEVLRAAAGARIHLARHRFADVLESPRGSGDFAGTLAYDLAGQAHGLVGAYLRGRAQLAQGHSREAAVEFQTILDHPGLARFAPYHALAPLYLARAYAGAGDIHRSRLAYEQFLSLWKAADANLTLLRAASREYARLPGS